MELTFLGTGSNNPSPHRGASSLGKNLSLEKKIKSKILFFSKHYE